MEPGGQARSGAPQPAAPGLWRARPAGGGGGASSWLLDGNSWLLCYGFLYLALYAQVSQSKPCERTGSCFSGRCVNSTCLCDPGWVGDQCQHCQGRFKLTEPSGYLTDGPINYKYKTKCTWLIEGYQVYCECDKYWKGEACDIPYCKANCGSPDHGYCDLTGEKLCVCNDSWQGPDCSFNVPSTESYWILPNVKPFSPSVGRASHKAVLHGKFMWVIGGYTFNYSSFQMVLNQSWSTKTPTVLGHGQQYAVEGHSAHIMELDSRDVVMIIIFGYSAIYGYTSSIQEYHISSNTWLVPETKGAIVQGGYGHTSVYDEITKSIYVHGGYKALPGNKYGLVDDLYKYEVNTKTWTILKESGFARYLHSAVLINGAMLIFGGNTHNDTSLSNGAKCFSADFLAYDIACDEWKTLPKPNLHRDVNRFGHSAVVINGSMYIFGGFSSVLLNDILVYKPPNCKAFRDEELCKNAGPGIKCIWNKNHCESWESANTNNILRAKCPPKTAASDDRCYRYADCASCTANTNGCQWCDDKKCISANSNCSVSVRNYTKCHVRNEQICNKLTSCKSCSLNLNCQWDQRQQECQALPAHLCGEGWSHIGDACLKINSSRESYDNAKLYCYNLSGNLASLTTSKEVEFVLDEIQKYTQQKVSPWVGLRKINISYWGWEDMSPFTNTTLQWLPGEPNDSGFCAYLERAAVAGLKANPCTSMADGLICEKPVVSPNQNARPCKKPCSLRTSCANCTSNGMECMWCSSTRRCVDSNAYIISFPYGQCLEWQTATCSPQNCSGLRTCGQCLEQPGCGWCNDPSNTGRGHCIEGSSRGPVKSAGIHSSEMVLDTSLCPKERNYEWSFIQCPACQCNGHSTCINNNVCEHCKNLTTGKQCQDCMPGYYGDPTNGGQCTDSLLIDYQFTFSLLQEDDRHHTAINFIANPEQSNKNLDISINASNNFNLNITWSVGSTGRPPVFRSGHFESKQVTTRILLWQPPMALMQSLLGQATRRASPLPLGSPPVFRSGRSVSKQLATQLLLWKSPVALMLSLLDQATLHVPPLPPGNPLVFRSDCSESKQLTTQFLLRQLPGAPVVAPSPSTLVSSHLYDDPSCSCLPLQQGEGCLARQLYFTKFPVFRGYRPIRDASPTGETHLAALSWSQVSHYLLF
ncbi:Attractin-like protein 1 [Sciurus carolinensis]|uniref:Attractin-like protein 1 n=1 Tax=Sciurus carolinensis TaxID=30640 RepID=A0AA41STY2_SCICA|nr:Attractin-like protein 1 [Sciurus carolinensis]